MHCPQFRMVGLRSEPEEGKMLMSWALDNSRGGGGEYFASSVKDSSGILTELETKMWLYKVACSNGNESTMIRIHVILAYSRIHQRNNYQTNSRTGQTPVSRSARKRKKNQEASKLRFRPLKQKMSTSVMGLVKAAGQKRLPEGKRAVRGHNCLPLAW